MTAPAALVSIELKRLSGLDTIGVDAAQRPYAVATIGGRFIGRSRLVAGAATELDFSAEPQRWAVTRPLSTGEALPFAVEIRDDRGDGWPNVLLRITGDVASPWLAGKQTFTDGGAKLEVEITTRYVPPDAITALVPRSPEGLSVPAVVVIPNVIVVEISNIRGLHKPVATPAPMRSEPTAGYRSEDDQGRIFINRDLAGKYASKKQLVEASVKIVARRGALPADAKVHWTLIDPSDPFDGDPHLHRQWTHYINGRDYDASGVPTGAKGGNNEGKVKSPRWKEVSAYDLEKLSDTEAKTRIVSGESKVEIRCPNVAGDSLVLRATVESATKIEVFEAETGIMTMWHRIHVEYLEMKSALPIPIDDVPPYLEAACAELSIVERTPIPDKQFIAGDEDHVSAESSKLIEKHAKHVKDPGWFFVVAAMEPHPLPTTPGGTIFKGKVDLNKGGTGAGQWEYFEIPGDHKHADYVDVTWPPYTVGFSVIPQSLLIGGVAYTRLWLLGHDVEPEFTAGDGSHAHAYKKKYEYYPRGMLEGAIWTAGGYGTPDNVDVEVYLAGAFYVSGVSPPIIVSSKKYFGGRIVMFTHHGSYCDYKATPKTKLPSFDADIVEDVAHEIVHAFGMPHKCGFYDYRTPRDETCPMNYSPNWMIDDRKDLIPGSSENTGKRLCGRHLKEVRRVHLEDNVGLKSLGW